MNDPRIYMTTTVFTERGPRTVHRIDHITCCDDCGRIQVGSLLQSSPRGMVCEACHDHQRDLGLIR